MSLFNKLKEPVFLKESSQVEAQLEKLKRLEQSLNKEGQIKIRQDIKCLEYGLTGERNIAFELKNSHIPMYILHDIYLEDGDLNAQIDYMVFTRKICFIIECKNLYGDIEIDSNGNFIRTIEFGGNKKKEGIYSPITQNHRHLQLIRKIRQDKKKSILTKFMTDKYFEDFNKSVVVLANPRTVLNSKFAKKEVKEQVIRADQLVNYIRNTYQNSNEVEESDSKLLDWANFYLELHKDIEKDYTERYEQYRILNKETENIEPFIVNANSSMIRDNIEETEIFKELKAYRLTKSREENIKPYFIYNNNQLKDLISKIPTNIEELQEISGFSEIKVNKYGEDILRIVGKFKAR